jgi:hypothetical protein
VVAPIATIGIDGDFYELPSLSGDSIMMQLKAALEAIRTGIKEDVHGWNNIVR